jgi:hypothetical protein
VTGPPSPSVWYFAQPGLVEVAYQLRRINHHLKVFAAVRKEAYARLQTTVMSQQYRGSAVDIAYPVESLREIFVNNMRLEKPERMVRPERLRADPIEAFLCRGATPRASNPSRTWSPARSGSPRNSVRSSPSGLPCGAPRR